MTRNVLQLTATIAIVLGLESSAAMAQTALAAVSQVPPVPTNLAVPARHSVFLKGHAVGTQNYVCLPRVWGGIHWRTSSARGGAVGEEVGRYAVHHFLRPAKGR